MKKKIRLKSLRATLFLLLAVLFAVLAALEAIPRTQNEGYVQASPFRVTYSANATGGYTYRATGSIKNQYGQKKFLDGVVVRVLGTNGETETIEVAVGEIAAGEVRKLSGETTAASPASKVLGVSTSVLAGDEPIPVVTNGFQLTTETIAFGALSFTSLVLSIIFFARRSHHHHHHNSVKA